LFGIHGASIGDPVSKQLARASTHEKTILTYEENGDINDFQIIQLESKISYINSKVDTYVLESALFRVLTFDGFLTLISADRVKIESFIQLIDQLGLLWKQLFALQFSGIPVFITSLDRANGLLNKFHASFADSWSMILKKWSNTTGSN
jgi:hypothetical protein